MKIDSTNNKINTKLPHESFHSHPSQRFFFSLALLFLQAYLEASLALLLLVPFFFRMAFFLLLQACHQAFLQACHQALLQACHQASLALLQAFHHASAIFFWHVP